MREIINAPSMATQKLETLNPSTKVAINQKRKPFMTKVKSPRVIKLIGKVRSKRMGLMVKLIIPKRKATISAV